MSYRLGINLGFAVNKYPEPEVWTKIVAEELGLHYVQFVADLLSPHVPEAYLKSQMDRIVTCKNHYGIGIESLFTSTFTRVNHLMHPDEEMRKYWFETFQRYLEIGAKFGAKTFGSHFGILTFASYEDQKQREFLVEEGVKGWQKLSFYAKELGYDSLIFEPMSVPREMGNTIAGARALMDRVNSNCGVPMKICLDVGHAPHPQERDPYQWIRELGSHAPVIHLQQTVLNRSNHSPFTPEHNKTGIITGEKVMEAVAASGLKDALFLFEISHREHYDTEFRIIQDLKESVHYWRPYIQE